MRRRMATSIIRYNTICLRGARVRRQTVPWVVEGRRLRGDAGEDRGMEAGLQEIWLYTMDGVVTREYEYGSMSTGTYRYVGSMQFDCRGWNLLFPVYIFARVFQVDR